MTEENICEIKSIREDLLETVNKKMKTEETYNEIAKLFKLLGDYNRLRIISALEHEELCVCELSLLLDMSQSSISHQLRLLRSNDMVKFRKKNKRVFYSLNNNQITKLITEAEEYEK
ncbi:ArsR/SmtB family transcription factor [Methanobrevibacter acididurans]|uniref:ArsR/SmtB family transcription factor n=1 Tax=Methanobrevibacter acididurans TaxID=120963 RepID=UPI0038FC4025